MSNRISCVKVGHLLHHTNIPYFHDTIRVARGDILAANREAAVINCVQMAEECLHGQARPHIPNRDTAIGGARNEEVSEGLEVETVDRICMLTILLSHLERVQIEEFHSAIIRG